MENKKAKGHRPQTNKELFQPLAHCKMADLMPCFAIAAMQLGGNLNMNKYHDFRIVVRRVIKSIKYN